MAIILLDNMEHHTSNTTDEGKWNITAGSITAGNGPNNEDTVSNRKYYLTFQNSNRPENLPYTETSAKQGYKHLIISCDWRAEYNYGNTLRNCIYLQAANDATTAYLRMPYNVPQIYSSSRVLASKKRFNDPTVWHHIEWEIYVDNTSGWTRLRVNGEILCYATGMDTQGQASENVENILLITSHNAGFTNLCVIAVTGDGAQTPLGIHTTETLYPTGNGDVNQFVNSSGNSTNNYQYIDSATPNADSQLVTCTGINNEDLYSLDNLLNTNNIDKIHAIEIVSWAAKNRTNPLSINPIYRISGVSYSGASMYLHRGDYDYYSNYFETNQASSSGFSVSDINEIQIGNKISN